MTLTVASSLLSQLCLQVSGLVQDLNVHLGTLIGKTWSPGDGRASPPSQMPLLDLEVWSSLLASDSK